MNFLALTAHSVGVLVPAVLIDGGLARWEVGVADGAQWLAAVLVQPWIAPRLDREPPRRYLVAGLVAMGLLAAAFLVAPRTFAPVLALRFAHGAALATYLTAIWTWIAALGAEGKLVRVFALFGISGLVTSAAGPALGQCVSRAGGADALFVTQAALHAAAALCGLALSGGAAHAAEPAPAPRFLATASSPALAAAVLAALCFGLLTGSLNTFLGPFLATLGLSAVAWFFAAYTALSVAIRLGGVSLAERVDPARLVVLPLVLLGAGVAVVSLVQPHGWTALPLLLAGAAVSGSGHGVLYPAVNALAVRRLPGTRGTAVAIVSAAINLGGAAGTPLAGLIASSGGYRAMFAAVATAAFASAAAIPWLERRSGVARERG